MGWLSCPSVGRIPLRSDGKTKREERARSLPRRAGGGTGQLGGQDLPTVSLMTPEGLKVRRDTYAKQWEWYNSYIKCLPKGLRNFRLFCRVHATFHRHMHVLVTYGKARVTSRRKSNQLDSRIRWIISYIFGCVYFILSNFHDRTKIFSPSHLSFHSFNHSAFFCMHNQGAQCWGLLVQTKLCRLVLAEYLVFTHTV